MATIFYLHASTASVPKPTIRQSTVAISKWIVSTLGGGQDGVGTIYPLDMTKLIGSDNTQSIRETSAELGTPYYGWYKAWISPALAAQTITGKLDISGVALDMNEGNLAHNTFPRVIIYVWKADDTGVRGILLNEITSGTEANTSDGTLQGFFSSSALSNVDTLDGDRIVIEIMGYDNNTKTASYLHALNFDGAPLSNRNSYISFTQTLIFLTAITKKKAISITTKKRMSLITRAGINSSKRATT